MPTEIELNPWPWNPEICPADQQAIEFIKNQVGDSKCAILHMGTGGHHQLGLQLQSRSLHTVGITLSPKEFEEYIKLIQARPELQRHYTCLFGDLHNLNFDAFRTFDIVTLFHLCEIDTGADITQTLKRIMWNIFEDSLVLGYRKSANARQAIAYLETFFEKAGEYKDLDIYCVKSANFKKREPKG